MGHARRGSRSGRRRSRGRRGAAHAFHRTRARRAEEVSRRRRPHPVLPRRGVSAGSAEHAVRLRAWAASHVPRRDAGQRRRGRPEEHASHDGSRDGFREELPEPSRHEAPRRHGRRLSARALGERGSGDAVPGWKATTLVETSPDGWGETNLKDLEKTGLPKKDDKDVKGPVSLAAAIEADDGSRAAPEAAAKAGETPKKARVVVFGDADWASNAGIANAANRLLLSSAVNWALERESLVAIPPKSADQVAVTLTRRDIGPGRVRRAPSPAARGRRHGHRDLGPPAQVEPCRRRSSSSCPASFSCSSHS